MVSMGGRKGPKTQRGEPTKEGLTEKTEKKGEVQPEQEGGRS